ncbi:MAG TPA: anti-sigma factor [Verrucomicrobiae bacterium]|nr:anti-sigma factor [Verrucomicrobiae bacterium]
MNCADLRPLLHAHVDGELNAASSIELQRHLKSCAACAAEEKSLCSLKTAFRQAPLRHEAPASLRIHVRQLAGDAKAPARPRQSDFSLLWKWLAAGATAFALLTLMLRPAGMSDHDRFLDEAVAGHVRSLMVEHLMDVVSTDQHTVKPWFDGKLDFAPDVKDFAAEGFPLVGGRLDYLNGRAVAALIYKRNKHFINVFVWPATGDTKPETTALRGYSIINTSTHGLHYCFVSDLNAKELGDLAALCQK